ncbi:hypothetical protein SDC9_83235 [bioreactor metagenome]|uniref:Uncharacterized protein n=1 Tax=bioreactor metagenome TaxID=1076179 RepID=A0A644Z705_9ZZZZ
MQLRSGRIAVQVQIHHAVDVLHQTHRLLQQLAQRGNIRSIQLEHHLAARARGGFLHAVADRLGKVEGHARNLAQRAAHLLDQLRLGQPLAPLAMRLQAHQRLGQVQRFVVGARFGAALLGRHRDHFRKFLQTQAHVAQHFLPFFQRDGRGHLHQHIRITLIELGQEFGAQKLRGKPRQYQHHHRHNHHHAAIARSAQHAPDEALISMVHAIKDARLFHHHMLGFQEQRAQRRHQPHRKHQRAQQRKAIGHRQRAEDAALDALQREHRDQRRDHDGHRKQRGLGHRHRRIDDDVAHVVGGLRLSQARVADDVLCQHHRAVHHDAEVDGAHRDQVGGHAQQMQPDEGHQQRQRNHRGHDQRSTHAAQKKPQHSNDQRRTKQQVVLHRGQRMADQIGAVIVGGHVHAFRQAALLVELFHLGVDVVQHHRRVLAALEQHNALHHVVVLILPHRTLARRVRLHHARHVANGHGRAAAHGNHHLVDFLRRMQQADAAHDQRLLAAAHQAAAHIAVGLGQRIAHVVQRQPQRIQLLGIDLDVELLHKAADAHHVGHTLHLLEHAHHMPFLLGAQLRQRVAVAGQAVVEDLAQRRVIRRHLGRHARRQVGLRQALCHLGARVEADRIVIEDEVDHRKPEVALGAQRHQPRRAVELALQRLGDLALHLFGGQTGSLGDHAHLHVGHVRIGLDGGVQIRPDAVDGDQRRGAQRQQSAMHHKGNEGTQHGIFSVVQERRNACGLRRAWRQSS